MATTESTTNTAKKESTTLKEKTTSKQGNKTYVAIYLFLLIILLVSLAYFITIQCFYYLVCDTMPCKNNGTCEDDEDNEKGYKCDCKMTKGFTGEECENEPGNTTI